jgi:hypothetical protein
MPLLLLITAPTDQVLSKDGKVRFPGSDAAVTELEGKGWTVEVIEPRWPLPLEKAKELNPDAALVACYKAVPRARDSASMLARMTEVPVYTVGVLQKDDAFRTMAPTVGVLRGLGELPAPS